MSLAVHPDPSRPSPRRRRKARKPAATTARVPGVRKIVEQLLPGFSRRLSAMLSAGMPIVTSLTSLERQTINPHFKATIKHVREGIENGLSMAESLQLFPSVFDRLYISMIKGGESGGQLAESIGRIAAFLEATTKLRHKVRAAMVYPVVVLCVALAITGGLILFVVPVFGEMFIDFDSDLPAPTQFLLDLSKWCTHNAPVILLGIALAVAIFRKWKGSVSGAYALDSLALSLPVFGDLTKKVVSARFARTFGQLLRSGVPILDSLKISADSTGNLVSARLVMDCSRTVERGEPLSSAMYDQEVLDPMLVDMLEAGEKSGKIDEMMDFTAGYFEDEVEVSLGALTSALEPVLMVIIGVMVGSIVVCMFLPIFDMPRIVAGG